MKTSVGPCADAARYERTLKIDNTALGSLASLSRPVSDSELVRAQQTHGEAGIPKLIRTLMSNPVLLAQVQSCFILAFDLLHRARCDGLLHARLDVAVDPSDIVDFADIFLGEGSSENKVQGMLQVNTFTPATDPRRFSPKRRAVWRSGRAMADSARFHADPVAISDIVHGDGQNSITIPFRIGEESGDGGDIGGFRELLRAEM
ncbi:hypothetical protein B0H10DRAFT_2371403 [Mycena sp. CBHHK59/15]|nr:hypothetical protein B0H10DRAFT_2371403 [Mycena sp. CBHHK59/15]